MKDMEIEKKYLLDRIKAEKFIKSNPHKYQVKKIEQCYISYGANSIVRVRKVNNAYILTEKSGQGSIRKEIERKISKKRYKKLKTKKIGYKIKKRRYIFEMDGYTFELDIFKGRFKNLSFLEVEFENLLQIRHFKLPSLLKKMVVRDVSEENSYSNSFLALKKYENSCIGKYLCKVLENYLKKMKKYANKFSKKDDMEILHRFRVNLRKAISLLNIHKEIFEPDVYKKLNMTLKDIFLKTDLKRDKLKTFFESEKFSKQLFDLQFFVKNCKYYTNALYMLPAKKYTRNKSKDREKFAKKIILDMKIRV